MLFNSYVFVFGFLPVTFLVFLALARYARPRAALGWLASRRSWLPRRRRSSR